MWIKIDKTERVNRYEYFAYVYILSTMAKIVVLHLLFYFYTCTVINTHNRRGKSLSGVGSKECKCTKMHIFEKIKINAFRYQ